MEISFSSFSHQAIVLNNMDNKFVGAINVYSLVANGGSGSFVLASTENIQIENFELIYYKITSSSVKYTMPAF